MIVSFACQRGHRKQDDGWGFDYTLECNSAFHRQSRQAFMIHGVHSLLWTIGNFSDCSDKWFLGFLVNILLFVVQILAV